jgi:hypothetical protein
MDDEGFLTMSTKEQNRLAVLNRVLERRLTQGHAAVQLGLSVRQVERLCRKLRLEGPPGLVSKNEVVRATVDFPMRCVSMLWGWCNLAITTLVLHLLPRSSVSFMMSSCRSRRCVTG